MTFSPSQCALEGFRLVRRRPVSFLAWAVIRTLLAYGPLVFLLWRYLPETIAEFAAMARPRADFAAVWPHMMQTELHLLALLAPWIVWIFLLTRVFYAAVYRAVLEPTDRGFAYLRVGGDELRLVLLNLIFAVLGLVFLLVLCIAGAAIVMGGRQLAQPWEGLLDVMGIVLLVCVWIYVAVRLTLAAPMTFARKELQIFDSWGLTRGSVWRLLGMILLIALFIMAAGMVFSAVRNAFVYGTLLPAAPDFVHAQPGVDAAARLWASLGPMIPAVVLVQGLFEAVVMVLAAAPLAAAYEALNAPRPRAA
jgi:hypothetical protein